MQDGASASGRKYSDVCLLCSFVSPLGEAAVTLQGPASTSCTAVQLKGGGVGGLGANQHQPSRTRILRSKLQGVRAQLLHVIQFSIFCLMKQIRSEKKEMVREI